ncbi:hypothetical protein J2X68_007528 [Streptomyces sp. 3330]|uniref:hypothetical protein n=1 Tax=Streptomyces sp. 3330 TaxID=2817755 RepID=UPI0028617321|nr:hypothetical protein [Streptomyces sp. 3330]MDR6980786.1 hypothetical protein [Streptomyces sp. 3330]
MDNGRTGAGRAGAGREQRGPADGALDGIALELPEEIRAELDAHAPLERFTPAAGH